MMLAKFAIGLVVVGVMWTALTGALYPWLIIGPTIVVGFVIAAAVNQKKRR